MAIVIIELIISNKLKLTLKIQKSVLMLYIPFLAQVSLPYLCKLYQTFKYLERICTLSM